MCLPETLTSLAGVVRRRDLFKLAAATAVAALPVAAEAASVQLPRVRRVVDLTHILGTQMPLFPGNDPVRITPTFSYTRDGYFANRLDFGEHSGTHMDAPLHFTPTGVSVADIPAEQLVGPLAVIDIRDRVARDPAAVVRPDDILAWERRYGRLPRGAIVVMNSGWATRINNPDAFLNRDASGTFQFPGWSKDATDFLLNERSVVGIGVDTLSLDHGPSRDFAVHTSWLPAGRWGLENVANLTNVPPSGAVLVVGAPKVYNGSGGPSRLLALM